MNKYSVFIDIMEDRDSNEVKAVEGLIVEANSANEAFEKAQEVASKEYDYYYIWEILEEDRI